MAIHIFPKVSMEFCTSGLHQQQWCVYLMYKYRWNLPYRAWVLEDFLCLGSLLGIIGYDTEWPWFNFKAYQLRNFWKRNVRSTLPLVAHAWQIHSIHFDHQTNKFQLFLWSHFFSNPNILQIVTLIGNVINPDFSFVVFQHRLGVCQWIGKLCDPLAPQTN